MPCEAATTEMAMTAGGDGDWSTLSREPTNEMILNTGISAEGNDTKGAAAARLGALVDQTTDACSQRCDSPRHHHRHVRQSAGAGDQTVYGMDAR
ncbi:hypothetical protein DCS_05433 [Drechmeria coniospora]|uniref:Uncharacterized protein n=1 Tax=Drechmeria coniospora TaxID=98403 RepID=A0A151GMW6_DRECN|nr:hypothetical protein DCS_05433 [Drechmeria coniospora]KYK58418.1 hypothetical protein DCS_05433 [Drechmeria coniospora]